ncbi:MAG TPA: hypothetical protein VF297_05115 [Pyrinomonadaceae bacterium]
MRAPSHLIYQAAGLPVMTGDATGLCRTCGAEGVGVLFTDWVKEGFTNHDQLRAGSIVCRACLFCFEDKSELLMLKTNRPTRQKMRTYSHFVAGGEWYALTKADKKRMRELLARGPEVAVIAESGQKHLVFRARVGWWQFEELSMLPDWPRVESLLGPVEELLTGFSKTEIESGNYIGHRVVKFGLERWRELSEPLRAVRLSAYFQLAIFLAQKDES